MLSQIKKIPIKKICLSPFRIQTLRRDNPELQQLAADIQKNGLQDLPLAAYISFEDRFYIIDGQKRIRASQINGETAVSCVALPMEKRDFLQVRASKLAQQENRDKRDLLQIFERMLQEKISLKQIAYLIGWKNTFACCRYFLLDLKPRRNGNK